MFLFCNLSVARSLLQQQLLLNKYTLTICLKNILSPTSTWSNIGRLDLRIDHANLVPIAFPFSKQEALIMRLLSTHPGAKTAMAGKTLLLESLCIFPQLCRIISTRLKCEM